MRVECNYEGKRILVNEDNDWNNMVECEECMPGATGRVVVMGQQVVACEKRLKIVTTEELMRGGGVDREFFPNETE
jgi:hypothetical protein